MGVRKLHMRQAYRIIPVSYTHLAINRIDGAAAKVSLKKGEAVVSYDREISNEELKKVVEDRGYHVVSIQ